MADAFRGLTLRIGADARPVQSALNAINSSASNVQRQLNKMNKALRFDGTNVGALASRIDLAGDKALHMARAATTVRTAMNQASKEMVEFSNKSGIASGKMDKVANATRNVYAQTQKIRAERTHVNAELQQVYDGVKKIVQASLSGEDAAENADKYVKALQRSMVGTGDAAKRNYEYMKMLVEQAGKDTNAGNNFGLDKTAEDAKQLVSLWERLHDESGRLKSDLSSIEKVEGFKSLRTELVSLKSGLREAATEATRFKAEFYAMSPKGLSEAVALTGRLKTATSAAVEEANVMDAAYRALPKSVEAARNKIVATRNAQQALAEQANALRAAMQKIESTDGFDRIKAGASNVHVAFEKASHDATELAADLKIAESRVESLNAELREANNTNFIGPARSIEKIKEELKQANAELAETSARARSADEALESAALNKHWSELRAQIAGVNTEMAELKARSSALNSINNFGAGLRELGYGLYSTVTPALMMAGRYAIQAAEDIDSAYRDMRKTVNGTEEQYEHLKQAAMDFSTTHVTSADQILEIEAMGGQLGITADNLEAFATTVSNLDIATNIDADTAAEQLGKMATVLGISVDQYDNFGDALVRLGNNMPVMESDIMNLMTRYMGMGKVVGMSVDQMMGWAAAASATGQKAEAAGSSMQRFIAKMETAVVGGGDTLKQWADVAGMSADEFAKAFRDNASDAMYKFVEGLARIQKEGGSVNQVLQELKINNVRDKQLLEGFANQMVHATEDTNVLRDALRMSSDAYKGMDTVFTDGRGVEKAGDAAREASKKAEGFSGALKIMKNQAQVLGATLAESAAPMVKDLGVMFGDLTDYVRSMPEPVKQSMLKVAAAFALIGPVSVAFGTSLRAVSSVVEAITGIGGAVSNMSARMAEAGGRVKGFAMNMTASAGKVTKGATAMNALGNAISMLGTPAGLIGISGAIAMIGGSLAYIIGGVAEAQGKIDTFNKATVGMGEAVKRSLDSVNASGGAIEQFGNKVAGAEYTIDKMPGVIDRASQAQAALVDRMNERTSATEAEIGQLNLAKSALDQYMNKTNLTALEQGKLRAAIELLNGTYGTHYTVVDASNGKIADESGALLTAKDSIMEFINAKKQQIQLESLAASYQEAEAQRLERMKDLMGQQANIDWLKQQRDQLTEGSDEWNEYNGYIQDALVYYGQLKGLYDADAKAADDLAARMGLVAKQAEGAKLTVGETAKASTEWGMAVDAFGANMNEFAEALDRAGADQEQFSKLSMEEMTKLVSAWQMGGMSMKDALESVGVSTRSLGDRFSETFSSAGGDMEQLNQRADNLASGIDDFAQKLLDAGITAQEFAQMGIDGFDKLLEAAGGDFAQIGVAIDLLNSQNIDPKNITVTDEGTIDNTTGKLWQLDIEAKKITDTQRVFRINSDGSITEITGELQEVDGTTVTANFEGDASGAEEAKGKADAASQEWDGTESEGSFNGDESDAVEAADNADAAGKGYDGNVYTGYADLDTSNAYSALNSLLGDLQAFENSTFTATVSAVEDTNAAGAIAARYAQGAILKNAMGGVYSRSIPRNASGALNGIVTRATMTNIGWVGEAGAEAVMHMRNAGGAVVPLTNRRYVRPFARAVASEMVGGGKTVNVSVNLNYQAGDDATKLARDVANRVEAYLNMGA